MSGNPNARVSTIAGIALSAYALFLHALFWRGAGPLWRDEAVSAVVSRTPWPQLLDRMQFDSFPALWLLLLRGWMALFGDGVASLRTLGVLTGITILAAIWFALRTLDVRAPLLAIALGGAAATVVRFGDSLRAYGLGAALGLLSMALLYRGRFAWATIASLAAVHTTYQNAPLLLACCVGAAVVHRDRRRAAIDLGIGALCAASLLVYLPTMERLRAWSDLLRYDINVQWILKRFAEAADINGETGAWMAVLIVAVVVMRPRTPAVVFAAIILIVYTVAQLAFLVILGYQTQPWYYLIWMCVAAVLVDVLVPHALVRAAAALLIAVLAFNQTRVVVAQRMTNVDVVARTLERDAKPGDIIVVYPWHLGASFHRYYHGTTPWQTLPPLSDYSVQRYDEAKKAITDMRERALVAAVTATLRRGGTVWYAGFPLFAEQSIPIGRSKPQVQADARWSGALQDALRGTQATMVVKPDAHTNPFENLALLRIIAP